jgi:guanine deaminase
MITVDTDGMIERVEDWRGEECDVVLPEGSFLLPGLIDTHIHAPQWPQLGTGLDLPLERWLFEYTFPLEARYSNLDFADHVWADLVDGLLDHGTTTAVYYATVDVDAATLLAKHCADRGQRALVGRVAMDHPDGTPDWYRDQDASAGVEASLTSIEQIQGLGSDLVDPIITPRFAPACTDSLLEGLGELAGSTGVGVQTHCSESDWEHGYALGRFGVSDTVALEGFGLVRRHSVLAHCDHVSNFDLELMRDRGAGVAHCPLSNSYFGNAVFPARRAVALGTAVGLGSDVAGGSQPGMLSQAATAVTVSRMLEDGVNADLAPEQRGVPGSRIDSVMAFWMATRGGAELLGHPTGLLEPGRQFDAFVVDTSVPGTALRNWSEIDDDKRTFEKIVRLGTAPDITRVWVRGRQAK